MTADEGTLLVTERVRLRHIVRGDHADLFALDTDPDVMRYIGDGSVRDDSVALTERIETCRAYYAENPGLGVFVAEELETGDFIGLAMLKHLDDTDEIEVGYRLRRDSWSRGFATEIARALVRHGFETLGLARIAGVVMPDNVASQRVLEKAGLEYERMDRYYGYELRCYAIEREATS